MFLYIYTFLLTILYVISFPFILILSFKKKYRSSLPARFLLWRNPPFESNGIWFHICSFGEARATKPLIERFDSKLYRLSTTTKTGFDVIKELTPNESRYLPFEPLLWFWIRPQRALVVVEAELWYLLFALAKAKGAKTFLINARISDRSWSKYYRFRWFYRYIFSKIDYVYAQSEIDRERLEALGAYNIKVLGSIKLSQISKPTRELKKPNGFLVCAGSTHEGEESEIIQAFRELKSIRPEAKMLIVPRHPERFDSVWRMIRSFAKFQNWKIERFSENENMEADLILVDKMGELVNCYAISDLVILGGAFEPIGGHNAAEVAQFEIPIITGEHFFNQRDLFANIEGITIIERNSLVDTLKYPKLLPKTRLKFVKDPIEIIEEEIRNVL